jgi:hypothetical protein
MLASAQLNASARILSPPNRIEVWANLRLAVASPAHQAALKEIAGRDRNWPEDAFDLAFIRSKL